MVVVPKNNGKIWICMDYINMNKARPKDDFLWHHIDILNNNAIKNVMYKKINVSIYIIQGEGRNTKTIKYNICGYSTNFNGYLIWL